jgi:hypothetical protein
MTRLIVVSAIVLAACGPSRTSYARYPGAPATFDKAAADPKALPIAEAMFNAAGGPGNWDKAKQIRWKQTVTADGKVTIDGEEAWDRWNARHHGRVHRESDDGKGGVNTTDIVVGYELYGTKSMGYAQTKTEITKKEQLDDDTRQKSLAAAKQVFNQDTGVMMLQFLALEPGAKLGYVGPAKNDQGQETMDEITVQFAGDPMRGEVEFHAFVDRTTHLPQRIELVKGSQKIGYTLADWQTVNGMKFAATRTNLGYSGEKTTIKDIKIGEPEDDLFIAPL